MPAEKFSPVAKGGLFLGNWASKKRDLPTTVSLFQEGVREMFARVSKLEFFPFQFPPFRGGERNWPTDSLSGKAIASRKVFPVPKG
ncbi:hypothetical protein DCS32_02160 [Dokdonia sp. Dokd-P16]|nr:hypothetical protein DCS32_02160 [Dokdonia sp. Dokd-P16]